MYDIFSKTEAQASGAFIRGGRITVLGSGGFTENPINAGGLAVYSCPASKIAKIKGQMIWTVLGTQTRIEITTFDPPSGRQVPVAVVLAVDIKETFEFDLTPGQSIIPRGDVLPNDATMEWLATITEKNN